MEKNSKTIKNYRKNGVNKYKMKGFCLDFGWSDNKKK
jgi:hypothetical protein